METASQAARNAIANRKKIIFFGKNKIEQKPKLKIKKIYFIAPILLILLLCPFLLLEKKYEVKGSIGLKGNFTNQQINFLDQEGNIKQTLLDENNSFQIKLRKGNYKIYFTESFPKKYLSPETSPLSIVLNRNLENLKIYMPKFK